MIVCPTALAGRLRSRVVAPTSVAALLADHQAAAAFRRLVEELFPDDWRAIWDAREADGDRETARAWALSGRVAAALFPVYECESYEQVAFEVPIVRFGWSFDRYHDVTARPGEQLLLALCAPPYVVDAGARLAVLDAAEALVGPELVARIPDAGLKPDELHDLLDGTPYEPAALFADWLFAQTDTVFLDADDEVEVAIEWSPENVAELTEQWRRAKGLLDRVAELAAWLEAEPAGRFARLLDAALRDDPHFDYLRERRHYAFEITPHGLVPVDPDQPLPLPSGAAA